MAEAYIVAAARTAGGKRGGRLSGWHPADLAGEVLRALVERNDLDPERIADVYLGAANQSGEDNRDVARMAALLAGLPEPGGWPDTPAGTAQRPPRLPVRISGRAWRDAAHRYRARRANRPRRCPA